MIAAILGALIVWACVSTVPAIALGKLLGALGDCEPDHPEPEPDQWDADWLPAWLFDQPTVPLTQGELDRFEDLLRGVS
jgi:hypothetical protein